MKKNYLTVYWDDIVQCVQMKWKGFAYREDFRLGLEKGLELLIEKKSHRWLANLTSLQVIDQEDQKWVSDDWFPRAIKGGMRSLAIVEPTIFAAKTGVERIMSVIDYPDLKIAHFNNVQEANHWLTLN